MQNHRWPRSLLFTAGVFLWIAATHVLCAGSATWALHPGSSDWNTAANWTPATVPNGPGDTATFDVTADNFASISAPVEVNGLVFQNEPFEYEIVINPGAALTISGAGVTHLVDVLESIINNENATTSSAIYFTNSATAGNAIVYQNVVPTMGGQSPLIQFKDSSNAGGSEFVNNVGPDTTQPGVIEFHDTSNAANGTFRNTGSSEYHSPLITFYDQASAGQGLFTNEEGSEGVVAFFDTSTADHATITNEAGYHCDLAFLDNSTAGNATVINEGGYGSGESGFTFLEDNSTAGNATFIADGSFAGIYGYGEVMLSATASAGSGTFMANGGQGSRAGGGLILLFDSATGESGTFTANGGLVSGANGGTIRIQNTATAGAGTFYAKGAAVDGAMGGRIRFAVDTPTAATATLIATGGVGDGEGVGGGIVFRDSSTGGEARVELDGNGFLDLQVHDAPGVTIGSLEGDGQVFLGNSNLSVGSNGLSTLFSGVIEDGNGVTTSSFTKLGTGTLVLTGTNTYSGPTFIQGGKLLINNKTGSATGNGPVMVGAGTLGGRGVIAGAVTVGTGTGAGAALVPEKIGGKPAILTLQSTLAFNSDASCVIHVNPKTRFAAQIVANGVSIDRAQLSLVSPGQTLPPHTVLTVIRNNASTPINGTFANLPDGGTITAGSNTFRANYEGGDGNDLTLTVIP